MSEESLQPADPLQAALARTPARLLMGRAGTHYRTSTLLKLREDHAAARDAVATEFDLTAAFGAERLAHYQLFLTKTLASDKSEYLMRPDLGRKFDEASRQLIAENCPRETDLQIVIGMQPPNDKALIVVAITSAVLAVLWFAVAKRTFPGPPQGLLTLQQQEAIRAAEAAVQEGEGS